MLGFFFCFFNSFLCSCLFFYIYIFFPRRWGGGGRGWGTGTAWEHLKPWQNPATSELPNVDLGCSPFAGIKTGGTGGPRESNVPVEQCQF